MQTLPLLRNISSRGRGFHGGFTGSCLCGKVVVRIAPNSEPTHDPAYCHCNTCRKYHSAPFALEAGWPLSSFEMTGDTVSYVKPESNTRKKLFERRRCAVCGTACGGVHHGLKAAFIPTTILAKPGEKLPEVLVPKLHLFYSRRIVGDLFEDDGLPKFEEFPPP